MLNVLEIFFRIVCSWCALSVQMTNIISEREELRERLKLLETSVGDHFSTEQSLNTLKETIMAEKKKYRETLNGLQRVCYFYLIVAL